MPTVEPERDARQIAGASLDGALLRMLRAIRVAPDEATLLVGAVDALAGEGARSVWIASDRGDGRPRMLAATGAGADAISTLAASISAGTDAWRDACGSVGLALAAWAPLGAARLPGAYLGIAVPLGGEAASWLDAAACAEIARCIGAAVDARADRAAADRQLLTSGRVAWLEVVRHLSRTVRHDLANVLTGISFYGSQIASDLPPGASAEDALAIGDAVIRASGLLEQLRDMWREGSEPEVVPLDPAAVVDRIASLLAAAAQPSKLDVDPLESMVVRASRRTLEESLLALVVDAREATAAGGVGSSPGTIRVGVAAATLPEGNDLGLGPGRYAAVVVDDDRSAPDVTVVGAPGSVTDTSPGEPGFAVALAAAGARAAGGGLRIERTRGGGTRTTILLPEAVSRRSGGSTFPDGTTAGDQPAREGDAVADG